jgi:hypothetical protein
LRLNRARDRQNTDITLSIPFRIIADRKTPEECRAYRTSVEPGK